MFKLTRPCVSCPFRVGVGENFQLRTERLRDIMTAAAFQCHMTVDYDTEREDDQGNVRPGTGEHPQQCAGLMSLLHRAGRANQIMQVGERLGAFDPSKLDHSDCYASIKSAARAHRQGRRRRRKP